jgi:DNA-binding response OmpR family regulator
MRQPTKLFAGGDLVNRTEQRLNDLIVVDAMSDDYDELIKELGGDRARSTCFATGEDALRGGNGSPATIWIVNIRLPDMSGISFLRQLRRRAPNTHVLLVGDVYSTEDECIARSAGATAYLCKPVRAIWLVGCRRRCRSPAIRAGPRPFT